MNGGHWTDQDFINNIYGIGPADGHLDKCADCHNRWTAMLERREAIVKEPEVSHEVLAAQRRNIYRRLGREPRQSMRAVPAFAAVAVLLAGFFFVYQTPKHPGPTAAISDTQLFADIYALEQNSEPSVAQPMRSLFEEN